MFLLSTWCYRRTHLQTQRIVWEICMPLIIFSIVIVYYLKDFINEKIFYLLQQYESIIEKYKKNTWYIRWITYGLCVSIITLLLGIIIKNTAMYVLPATPFHLPKTPSLATALRPPRQRMRARM